MKKWTVIILAALLALVISAAALENEPAAEPDDLDTGRNQLTVPQI